MDIAESIGNEIARIKKEREPRTKSRSYDEGESRARLPNGISRPVHLIARLTLEEHEKMKQRFHSPQNDFRKFIAGFVNPDQKITEKKWRKWTRADAI
ncbi:MAG: hypothetical protein K6F46_00550 [Desulfovibrio sp.]|nr:hypothetical protein [Desulfovibrio sp.]